jgi:hypothetical protein
MATDTSIKMFKRDTENIVVTVKDSAGVAIDITGYTFWLTIKTLEAEADADAELQKEVTTHTTPTGGITTLPITSAESGAIEVGDYQYDIQMKSVSGDITTLIRGTFIIEQDITVAT